VPGWGELLALRSEDINFERKTVQIKHSVTNISREIVLQTTKTKSALRTIPIDEATVNVLKNHKKLTTERALKLGFGRIPWVFWSDKTGSPLHPTNASRAFKMAVEKSRVPMIRFHDLRHYVELYISATHMQHFYSKQMYTLRLSLKGLGILQYKSL